MMRNWRFFAWVLLVLLVPQGVGSRSDYDRFDIRTALWSPQGAPRFESLDSSLTTAHFSVHYSLTNCGPSGQDCLGGDAQAQAVGDILEQGYELYVNDPRYGFRPPLGTGTPESPELLDVYIMDLDGICGVAMWATPAPHDYIKLDAGCVRDHYQADNWREIQSTPIHELFHRVQYAYDKGPEEKWCYEGSATAMQDKVFGGADSLDTFPGSSYLLRVNRYLANPNRVDYEDYGGRIAGLRSASYYAGLFWTYYMQTCGSVEAEPAVGMDAMRIFWEQTLAYDGIEAMDHAVQQAPGCPDLNSMEDLFHEFIVANYVKLMGNAGKRYQYVDEQGPHGTRYDDVHLEAKQAIRPGAALDVVGAQVAPWGANYYVAEPDGTSCRRIEVELDGAPGQRLLYSILVSDAANNAFYHDAPLFRHRGQDLVRTLANEGWSRVAVIVGATDAGAQYDVHVRCVEPVADVVFAEPQRAERLAATLVCAPRPPAAH